MNIFKSLSQGHGRISETNITSFLSYLLNSSTELNNSFLVLFFELIDENLASGKLLSLLNITQKTTRDKILEFSKKYSVIAEPEHAINGRKQVVDILLKITAKNEEEVAYILIENKIKKESAKKEQVQKQYEAFLNSEDYSKNTPVYSVLLTIDSTRFSTMLKNVADYNSNSVWLKWTNFDHTENSIEAILRKLIRFEHEAEIQPIDPNTQFIIKSFIDYILSEYTYKQAGKKNFSFNGFNEVATATARLGDEQYIIKRFENHMIRLFDVNGNLLKVEVKPILRQINDVYNLNINLFHSTGPAKNTQILGREIINMLNNGSIKSNDGNED